MTPRMPVWDRVSAGMGTPADDNGVDRNVVWLFEDCSDEETEAPVVVDGVWGDVVVAEDLVAAGDCDNEGTRTSVNIGGVDGETCEVGSNVVDGPLEGV